tara:strand:+ start:43 stop:525 length:483 start_codon:yes stop_codon:yes gene_type:complete
MKPYIYQINKKPETKKEVGLPKIKTKKATVLTGGIDGDYNRFRENKKNGDPNMALMILSLDIINELNNEGWSVMPGDLGENLTIDNLDYSTLKPGQKYTLGTAKIEISLICDPCSNLKILPYVGIGKISDFIKTLMGRRGWYARVLEPGIIAEKDHMITI